VITITCFKWRCSPVSWNTDSDRFCCVSLLNPACLSNKRQQIRANHYQLQKYSYLFEFSLKLFAYCLIVLSFKWQTSLSLVTVFRVVALCELKKPSDVSDMPAATMIAARRNNPEGSHPHIHCHENLKYLLSYVLRLSTVNDALLKS
jgi:hypothetical protein